MKSALYFHPEAYTTEGPKLMGRNAAGASFLRGFLQYSKNDEFWLQVQKREHADHFLKTARFMKRYEPINIIDPISLNSLSCAGVVYHPGPGIGMSAFHRSAFGSNAWSLCGITHTTSSAGAMDAITDLLTSPIESWDALICTSEAVKKNVEYLLEAQAEYLQQRLGATKIQLPNLPVIPLGIHAQDFIFTDLQKLEARKQLKIYSEEIVVLFMGRLSFHAKAHPAAMYRALELATKKTGKQVTIIECGWFANEYIEKAFYDAAALLSPTIKVYRLDGRELSQRSKAWAAADIFCSLSDNIQETFGLTPIEAMAAGLPVIVSDWNGYKETVRDGVDGIRIQTTVPMAGAGSDLAWRHSLEIDSYDRYCGNTSQLTAVDVQQAACAFEKLIKSKTLRKQMGSAGQQRATAMFDWKIIIEQYEELWMSLETIRNRNSRDRKKAGFLWPARLDPFSSFSHYASRWLTEDTPLCLVDETNLIACERLHKYLALAMINFASHVIPTEKELTSIIMNASKTQKPAKLLLQGIDQSRKEHCLRALNWLLKLDILKINE